MRLRLLGPVLALCLSACSARVAGGLDEPRVNEALARLEARGIRADKVRDPGDESFAIEVGRGDLGRAVQLLDEAGLPRAEEPGVAETYAEASLVPSPDEERVRYEAAVAGEVSRTLERIDGVLDARVHVSVPPRDPLAIEDARPPSRASVLLRARPDARIDADGVRAIVVGAVEGLVPEAVSVVRTTVAERRRSDGDFADVGPFRVARGSALPLRGALLASLLVHVGMAISVVHALRRRSLPTA